MRLTFGWQGRFTTALVNLAQAGTSSRKIRCRNKGRLRVLVLTASRMRELADRTQQKGGVAAAEVGA